MPGACLDLSLPPSPLRFFLPPAVQFTPCPVFLIIIVFKPAQCMPRSVPAPIATPALPAPSGSVHLMLAPPPPPCPVYLIIIVFKHAQCMPRSVPAPIAPPALPALPAPSGSVQLLLLPPPPPCPVYLIVHAETRPAPIAPPALPAPSGSVHLMLLPPPPMPRLSHKNRIEACPVHA